MTNEEAITVLEKYMFLNEDDEIYTEAVSMAIEALRKEALVEKMTKAYYKELRKEADNDKTN